MSILTPHFVYGGQLFDSEHEHVCSSIIDFLQRYALVDQNELIKNRHQISNFKIWVTAMLKRGRPRSCVKAVYEHLEGFFWLEDKKYRETLIYLFKRQIDKTYKKDVGYRYPSLDFFRECQKQRTKYSPTAVVNRGHYVTDGLIGMVLAVHGTAVVIHVNPCCTGKLYGYDVTIGAIVGKMEFSRGYVADGFKQLDESRSNNEAIVQKRIMPVLKRYDPQIIGEIFCLSMGCYCIDDDEYDSN